MKKSLKVHRAGKGNKDAENNVSEKQSIFLEQTHGF